MGDVLGLIEEAERKVDKRKADRLARKIRKGRKFDLVGFSGPTAADGQHGRRRGPRRSPTWHGSTAAPRPGSTRWRHVPANGGDHRFHDAPGTPLSRHHQRVRANAGSPTAAARASRDVNQLLKQHRQMQKVMRKVTRKGGMDRMMRGLAAAENASRGPPADGPPASVGAPRRALAHHRLWAMCLIESRAFDLEVPKRGHDSTGAPRGQEETLLPCDGGGNARPSVTGASSSAWGFYNPGCEGPGRGTPASIWNASTTGCPRAPSRRTGVKQLVASWRKSVAQQALADSSADAEPAEKAEPATETENRSGSRAGSRNGRRGSARWRR